MPKDRSAQLQDGQVTGFEAMVRLQYLLVWWKQELLCYLSFLICQVLSFAKRNGAEPRGQNGTHCHDKDGCK